MHRLICSNVKKRLLFCSHHRLSHENTALESFRHAADTGLFKPPRLRGRSAFLHLGISFTPDRHNPGLGCTSFWKRSVRSRRLLPRANEHGARCPPHKPQIPPSKEPRGALVLVPSGGQSVGNTFIIFPFYHKISGKRQHVEGARQTSRPRLIVWIDHHSSQSKNSPFDYFCLKKRLMMKEEGQTLDCRTGVAIKLYYYFKK